jgi:hypothetical protein
MRHRQIEQQYIRMRPFDCVVHLATVAYRTNYRVRRAKQLAKPVAHERMIVGDEDGWATLHRDFQ